MKGVSKDKAKNLYEETSLFLYKIFTIDTISFEDVKPFEKLTFERIFNDRCKKNEWSMPVFDKLVFAERELEIIESCIQDMEKYYPHGKNYLIHEPTYSTAKGYINFLNNLIPPKDAKSLGENAKEKGRPKAISNESFTRFLKCTIADKNKIVEILKEYYQLRSWPGVVEVIKVLEKKEYYIAPQAKATLWASLQAIIGEQCSNENLNRPYRRNSDKEIIEKINKQLPE